MWAAPLFMSELSNSGYVGCTFVYVRTLQPMVCGLHLCLCQNSPTHGMWAAPLFMSQLSNPWYVGYTFVYVRTLQLRVCGLHVCSYQGCPTRGMRGSISLACDSIFPYVTQNLLVLPTHLEVLVNLVALTVHQSAYSIWCVILQLILQMPNKWVHSSIQFWYIPANLDWLIFRGCWPCNSAAYSSYVLITVTLPYHWDTRDPFFSLLIGHPLNMC